MKATTRPRKRWLQSILLRFITQVLILSWLIAKFSFISQMPFFMVVILHTLLSTFLFYSAYQKKGNRFLLFYMIYIFVLNLRDAFLNWSTLFSTPLSASIFLIMTSLEILVFISSIGLFIDNRKRIAKKA